VQAYKWYLLGEERQPTDRHCWGISLKEDSSVTSTSHPLEPSGQQLLWDPVIQNNWELTRLRDEHGECLEFQYVVLKPTIFKYAYLVSDREVLARLRQFFGAQGIIEHCNVSALANDSAKLRSWVWYSLIPFRIAHLIDSVFHAGGTSACPSSCGKRHVVQLFPNLSCSLNVSEPLIMTAPASEHTAFDGIGVLSMRV
jgi:hypothetical protein